MSPSWWKTALKPAMATSSSKLVGFDNRQSASDHHFPSNPWRGPYGLPIAVPITNSLFSRYMQLFSNINLLKIRFGFLFYFSSLSLPAFHGELVRGFICGALEGRTGLSILHGFLLSILDLKFYIYREKNEFVLDMKFWSVLNMKICRKWWIQIRK